MILSKINKMINNNQPHQAIQFQDQDHQENIVEGAEIYFPAQLNLQNEQYQEQFSQNVQQQLKHQELISEHSQVNRPYELENSNDEELSKEQSIVFSQEKTEKTHPYNSNVKQTNQKQLENNFDAKTSFKNKRRHRQVVPFQYKEPETDKNFEKSNKQKQNDLFKLDQQFKNKAGQETLQKDFKTISTIQGQKIIEKNLTRLDSKQLKNNLFQAPETNKTDDYLKPDQQKFDFKQLLEIGQNNATRKERIIRKKLAPLGQSINPITVIPLQVNKQENESSMIFLKKKQSNSIPNQFEIESKQNSVHQNESMLKLDDDQVSNKIKASLVPITKNKHFRCILRRQQQCCSSLIKPNYSILTSNSQFILNARKQFGNLNSLYNISSSEKQYKQSNSYIGYSEGNFFGTIFNIYQKDKSVGQKGEMVGTVFYESQITCRSKYRNIQIYLKNQNCSSDEIFGNNKQSNLKQLYSIGQNSTLRKIVKLVNKKPRWDQDQGCYVLNFRGRSKMASVKNLILVEESKPNDYVMLFCKTEKHQFYLQISYPLSLFLALGILVTSFDFKLASE